MEEDKFTSRDRANKEPDKESMKIPNTIKIYTHNYRVELVDGEEVDDDCGECNVARATIKIRKDMAESQQMATLIHEIIHALDSNIKEDLVSFLSESLYQVLKENRLIK